MLGVHTLPVCLQSLMDFKSFGFKILNENPNPDLDFGFKILFYKKDFDLDFGFCCERILDFNLSKSFFNIWLMRFSQFFESCRWTVFNQIRCRELFVHETSASVVMLTIW